MLEASHQATCIHFVTFFFLYKKAFSINCKYACFQDPRTSTLGVGSKATITPLVGVLLVYILL